MTIFDQKLGKVLAKKLLKSKKGTKEIDLMKLAYKELKEVLPHKTNQIFLKTTRIPEVVSLLREWTSKGELSKKFKHVLEQAEESLEKIRKGE